MEISFFHDDNQKKIYILIDLKTQQQPHNVKLLSRFKEVYLEKVSLSICYALRICIF